MIETEKCMQPKLTTLNELRDRARLEKRGFEVNEHNLQFHSLPDFMTEIIQSGGNILVDMGGNIFILGWHDRK